jgi:hypothetical protein
MTARAEMVDRVQFRAGLSMHDARLEQYCTVKRRMPARCHVILYSSLPRSPSKSLTSSTPIVTSSTNGPRHMFLPIVPVSVTSRDTLLYLASTKVIVSMESASSLLRRIYSLLNHSDPPHCASPASSCSPWFPGQFPPSDPRSLNKEMYAYVAICAFSQPAWTAR